MWANIHPRRPWLFVLRFCVTFLSRGSPCEYFEVKVFVANEQAYFPTPSRLISLDNDSF
jgi:hypothetical protein